MRTLFRCLILAILLAGCDAYGPKPTPAQSPTPKPTVLPPATVGPLTPGRIDPIGLSLLLPSTWKPPVAHSDQPGENGFVLSPDGSPSTSVFDGPFLYIIVGSTAYFHSKLSFPLGITDPQEQLQAIISGLNDDEPDMGTVTAYGDAKYPGATVTYFNRNNQDTITLLKVADDRWIYIGAQAKATYFAYYQGMVFKPIIESMAVADAATRAP
ncbi:MAG TPA: hypothetical protein VMT34_08475 [Aggregatilineales bacterium]|nr:hypothetical protein [Aggregatilineales bacterium]